MRLAFLLIGMFIDAIPAIIILGTVLFPVTQHVGMHPIHFGIIGIMSLAFGLVTLWSVSFDQRCNRENKTDRCAEGRAVILLPMIFVLLIIILVAGSHPRVATLVDAKFHSITNGAFLSAVSDRCLIPSTRCPEIICCATCRSSPF